MIDAPFGPAVPSVPLRDSPLTFVVAQIRFPLVASISEERFIGPFQEKIRGDYSDLRKEMETQVLVGPDGAHAAQGGVVWRFTNDPGGWEVALAPEFIALATRTYSNRGDFLSRLDTILVALGEWLDLRKIRRVGVRYIDRISAPQLAVLPTLVRPEILGAVRSPLADSVQLHHALHDYQYHFEDETTLRARWGYLDKMTTFDPGIEPLDQESWVLDLDASHGERAFDPAAVRDQVQLFSDRIYRYFRWAITEQFLASFGAET